MRLKPAEAHTDALTRTHTHSHTHTLSPSLQQLCEVMSVCVCVCATPCKNNKSTSLPLILFYLIISPSALPLCLHPPPPPTFTSLCLACTHLFSHSPTLSPHTPGTPTPPLLLFQARHSRLLKMSSVEQRLCCKQRGRG